MKMKKTEIAALAITLAFSFFAGGYLLGRSQPAGVAGGGSLPVITASGGVSDNARDDAETQAAPALTTPAPEQDAVQEKLRININTATPAELTDLPGIGEQLASRIIDYREQNGAFGAPEDIMKVSGIGEKKFEAIRDYITTG